MKLKFKDGTIIEVTDTKGKSKEEIIAEAKKVYKDFKDSKKVKDSFTNFEKIKKELWKKHIDFTENDNEAGAVIYSDEANAEVIEKTILKFVEFPYRFNKVIDEGEVQFFIPAKYAFKVEDSKLVKDEYFTNEEIEKLKVLCKQALEQNGIKDIVDVTDEEINEGLLSISIVLKNELSIDEDKLWNLIKNTDVVKNYYYATKEGKFHLDYVSINDDEWDERYNKEIFFEFLVNDDFATESKGGITINTLKKELEEIIKNFFKVEWFEKEYDKTYKIRKEVLDNINISIQNEDEILYIYVEPFTKGNVSEEILMDICYYIDEKIPYLKGRFDFFSGNKMCIKANLPSSFFVNLNYGLQDSKIKDSKEDDIISKCIDRYDIEEIKPGMFAIDEDTENNIVLDVIEELYPDIEAYSEDWDNVYNDIEQQVLKKLKESNIKIVDNE